MSETDYKNFRFPAKKRIALVAHDSRKKDMLEWVKYNRASLTEHELYATGTTGAILAKELGLDIHLFKSGPLGGDQQIGARIAEHQIEIVIFLWDPLMSHPHEPDIYALQRIATTYNVVLACDRSTADFIISSPLMNDEYEKVVIDFEKQRLKRAAKLIETM
ncbi:Methylglyoxal synthase [hydrothermal vent metagenome]|uniref:Methylglyoxal synthase n=1 Tax=hydrothermal vent metagenome TaxID=652676 RepID=A0A3B1CM48_9ZZZZ